MGQACSRRSTCIAISCNGASLTDAQKDAVDFASEVDTREQATEDVLLEPVVADTVEAAQLAKQAEAEGDAELEAEAAVEEDADIAPMDVSTFATATRASPHDIDEADEIEAVGLTGYAPEGGSVADATVMETRAPEDSERGIVQESVDEEERETQGDDERRNKPTSKHEQDLRRHSRRNEQKREQHRDDYGHGSSYDKDSAHKSSRRADYGYNRGEHRSDDRRRRRSPSPKRQSPSRRRGSDWRRDDSRSRGSKHLRRRSPAHSRRDDSRLRSRSRDRRRR